MTDYLEASNSRQAQYDPTRPPPAPSTSRRLSFNSIYSIPHSTQINSFSTTPCCTNLYTGGSDGFIRRYSLYSTLNGNSSSSSSNVQNLTMKQQQQQQQPTKDTPVENRVPVLTGYWENEESPDLPSAEGGEGEGEGGIKWGTKLTATSNQSNVYSLAIHSQELWGLSGTSVSLSTPLSFLFS